VARARAAERAVSWIDALVENVAAIVRWLSPVFVTRSYEAGVVFRVGIPVRAVGGGLRWKWPCGIEEVDTVQLVEQVRNLLSQSVTTRDNRAVTFSVNLVYKVVDPTLHLVAVGNFATSLDGLSMTHLAKRVREMQWEEFLVGQDELERSLKGTLSTRLKDWGAEITRVGFTDAVQARTFRLYGDAGMADRVLASGGAG
jgi:regulator of protease activity HflC (stomatin/prohibitin superfamily)